MYLTNLSKLEQGGMFDAFDNFFNMPVARKDWDTLGITGPDYKTGEDSLMVSLPGFSKKDINIEIEGQILTISAEEKEDGFTQAFSKRFKLPATIDMDSILATMKDGILKLEFKTADNKKTISIK
jgi:HSP20 family molecular chaperone IbpA|tara:strand:- start:459 stop:833 length:375 start_codon:yes stop_codon:yes gene_type:complete